MYRFAKAVLVAAVVLLPTLVHAQSLAGTVRDASGAVLPGVTVEAASPVSDRESPHGGHDDGTGQYRLENLVPGTYTVTFSLAGFVTVSARGRGGQRRGRSSRSTPTCASAACRKRSPSPARRRSSTCRPARTHAEGDRQRGRVGTAGVARLRQHPRHRARHSGDRPQLRRQSRS